MRLFLILAAFLTATSAFANDKVFKDYDHYQSYVDNLVMTRDFIPLVKALGGKDEYSDEELGQLNQQLLYSMPYDFTNVSIVKQVQLADGFSQEMRVYWNNKASYVFYYAFLHQHEDGLIVLKFNMNTSSAKVFAQF